MADPFHWLEDATAPLAATSVTSNVALKRMPTGLTQIRLYNAGAATVFIRKGTDVSVTATVTDFPIPAGVVEVMSLNNNPSAPITHIAGVTASGTATLYITTGAGE